MQIIERWLKIVLINLCIVALLGVTLRYKIAFSLPFIDQRNLLHGHSHFAFAGWITQALMILLLYYLHKQGQENLFKRYKIALIANLLTAYGMLISFPIEGYGFFSILFSTLNIFASYLFAVMYWKDLNKLKVNRNSHLWFKAALFFNVISSLGPYCLAYVMASHSINQKVYLISIYYFLHFQYNGWFLFACLGLFISKINELAGDEKKLNYIFWIFFLSCFPCFFLSALWLPIPKIIYVLVVLSAIMQLTGWIWLTGIIHFHIITLKNKLSQPAKWLMLLSAISMSIKLLLQLGSTYPSLSQMAFGFRPIVIGYIHLVLLGVISIFILSYMISEKLFIINKPAVTGIIIFVSGVFINEILLMIEGIFALATISISHINLYLFIAALIMFTGICLITLKQYHLSDSHSKQ
jgi:hypothetical protein